MGSGVRISASLMCGDLMAMGAEVDTLVSSGVDLLHVDVMDGHYVPPLELGESFCRALARRTRAPLDIHLMVEDADRLASRFTGFAGSVVSFHIETARHPIRTAQALRSGRARAGIALDPAQPVSAVVELLPHVSQVLVMAVNPGFAGQSMIPGTLEKLSELWGLIRAGGWPVDIAVDGNVSWQNIPSMVRAGARVLVAGSSSLYDGGDLADNLRRIREIADGALRREGP